MEEEEWRKHPVSNYSVSESGRVVNIETNRELKPHCGTSGYFRIGKQVCRSGMVHTAVIEAFSGQIVPKGMQVNHIDGNKTNNHYTNLEVCTPSENTRHAYKLGLSKARQGEDASGSKVTEAQILQIYEYFCQGLTNEDIGKIFDLHERYISLVRHGKRWKHIYDREGIVFPQSHKQLVHPKSKIIEAWEMIKTTDLINKQISDITGIEASMISRLRSGQYAKTLISEYEDGKMLTTINN